jgi:hypothetical protein
MTNMLTLRKAFLTNGCENVFLAIKAVKNYIKKLLHLVFFEFYRQIGPPTI